MYQINMKLHILTSRIKCVNCGAVLMTRFNYKAIATVPLNQLTGEVIHVLLL